MADSHSNGTVSLEARLKEPDTAAALNRLIDRIDTLESVVDKLAEAMTQGPGMAALFVDVADDAAARAMDAGIDLDARMKNALMLAEKFTAPKTVEVLGGLIDRIDRIEEAMAMADQAPGMAALFVDIADDTAAHMMNRGIDLDARMKDAFALTEKLTEPRNMRILSGLVDRLEQLDEAVRMADQAPGMVSMFVDIADDAAARIQASGVDIDDTLRHTVAVTASAATALAQAHEATPEDPPRTGVFTLLRSLRHPDIQRALAFLLGFARSFGKNLKRS